MFHAQLSSEKTSNKFGLQIQLTHNEGGLGCSDKEHSRELSFRALLVSMFYCSHRVQRCVITISKGKTSKEIHS